MIGGIFSSVLAVVLLVFEPRIAGEAQQLSRSSNDGGTGAPGSQVQARAKIGIFGFGSLIADPGEELASATESRIEAETPFAVEYGRTSRRTRGGAPTLVPVKTGGAKVKATIFVLKDSLSEQDARDILWRRETRQVGSGKRYKQPANPGANSVLVAVSTNYMGLHKIFYTDFADSGKLVNPTPTQLAELAVKSARNPGVPEGMDGISYLMAAKKAGIRTPLSADYEKEILRMTGTSTLQDALRKARNPAARKRPRGSGALPAASYSYFTSCT
jgi:hypothetical protein